jgi:phosphatidylethanolamine N-methyltransferase
MIMVPDHRGRSLMCRPHMTRLYGDRLRKDGGLTKTLKTVAGKTLVNKAGRRGDDFKRVVQEVRGTIDKVEEKVTEAVGDFLDHGEFGLPAKEAQTKSHIARPMFSEVVNDTKFLLQQSRERMIITCVVTVLT